MGVGITAQHTPRARSGGGTTGMGVGITTQHTPGARSEGPQEWGWGSLPSTLQGPGREEGPQERGWGSAPSTHSRGRVRKRDPRNGGGITAQHTLQGPGQEEGPASEFSCESITLCPRVGSSFSDSHLFMAQSGGLSTFLEAERLASRQVSGETEQAGCLPPPGVAACTGRGPGGSSRLGHVSRTPRSAARGRRGAQASP